MINLKEIFGFLNHIPKMMGELNMPSEKVDVLQDIRCIIREWKEYTDLEKQGKLLKTSCSLKDSVYVISRGEIIPMQIIGIRVFLINSFIVMQYESFYDAESWTITFTNDNIGKTVFLTQEEAEAILEKE